MKNYVVRAKFGFDDYEGLPVEPQNPHVWREKGVPFNCTKERYLYLKSKNAVDLVGIEQMIQEPLYVKEEPTGYEEPKKEEVKKVEIKEEPKKKTRKKIDRK